VRPQDVRFAPADRRLYAVAFVPSPRRRRLPIGSPMSYNAAFMSKVEDAIANGSAGRRGEMLRHVTDLFLISADQFSSNEIALFDDVFGRLMVDIEVSARALLATRLATINNAPPKIVRKLAFDDVIDVAGPVLSQSDKLDDPALVENARSKSQEHLLAITRRRTLSPSVTDVLVERGNEEVLLSAVQNGGATFSERGFARLVQLSEGNEKLTTRVGARPEIPPRLFNELLTKASKAVREKLEAEHPHAKREVRQAVTDITNRIREEALAAVPDTSAARERVAALRRSGGLDERALASFADSSRFEETSAAIALMCDLPVEFIARTLSHDRSETILIICRAIGVNWPTVKSILVMRNGKRGLSAQELAQNLASFERLRTPTAREIVRFYRLREQPAANARKA
jgi:uncharacterized protein (DUF2336 family)